MKTNKNILSESYFHKETEGEIIISPSRGVIPPALSLFLVSQILIILLSFLIDTDDTKRTNFSLLVILLGMLILFVTDFIKSTKKIVIHKQTKKIYQRKYFINKQVGTIDDLWYIHISNNKCYIRKKSLPYDDGLCIIKTNTNPYGLQKLIDFINTLIPGRPPIEEFNLLRRYYSISKLKLFTNEKPHIYKYTYLSLKNKIILGLCFSVTPLIWFYDLSYNTYFFIASLLLLSFYPKRSKIEVNMEDKTIRTTLNHLIFKERNIISFNDLDVDLVSSVDNYFYPELIDSLMYVKDAPLYYELTANLKLILTRDLKWMIYQRLEPSLMMIRLVVQNSHCSIDLFHKNKTNHLMRKSHS